MADIERPIELKEAEVVKAANDLMIITANLLLATIYK